MHGLKSGRTLKEFRGHTSFVNCAIFNPEQTMILSASSDGTVRIWDVKTSDCIRTIKMNPAGAVNPNIFRNLNMRRWNRSSLPYFYFPFFPLQPTSLLSVCILPSQSDRYVVLERSGVLRVISQDGTVAHVFQSTGSSAAAGAQTGTTGAMEEGKPESASAAARSKKPGAHGEAAAAAAAAAALSDFVCVCVSPKGQFIYSVTEECVLHCFDLSTLKLVHAIKLHRSDILGITHHPHRNIIASYAQDSTLKLWKP
jgi:WD40 repeat-containing protein SMU1